MAEPDKKKQKHELKPDLQRIQDLEQQLQEKEKLLESAVGFIGELLLDVDADDFEWDNVPHQLKNCTEMRQVTLDVFREGLIGWEDLILQYSSDKEFCFAALNRGIIDDLAEVPGLTQDFVLEALRDEQVCYRNLPFSLRQDPSFGRSIIASGIPQRVLGSGAWRFDPKINLALDVFRDCSALVQEGDLWEVLIRPYRRDLMHSLEILFNKFTAPVSVRSNRELMKIACNEYFGNLKHVHSSLGLDLDFVGAVIEDNAYALKYVSEEFVEQFSEFVKSKLAGFCHATSNIGLGLHEYRVMASKLEHLLTTRTDFINAWFEAGLPFFSEIHPVGVGSNRKKLLLVAERCPDSESRRFSLNAADQQLRGDREFMTRAIKFDPHLLDCATDNLRQNFEMQMLVFSSSRYVKQVVDNIYSGVPTDSDPYEYDDYWDNYVDEKHELLECLLEKGRDSLFVHDTFINPFLCGLQFEGALVQLNHLEVKLIISDFVGVCRGEHLGHIRAAVANLTRGRAKRLLEL